MVIDGSGFSWNKIDIHMIYFGFRNICRFIYEQLIFHFKVKKIPSQNHSVLFCVGECHAAHQEPYLGT